VKIGTVQDIGATKGILVTTSRFTRGAEVYLSRHPWLLEGRDFNGLVEWLQIYDEGQMKQMGGIL
jgi:hypothetical protein